MSEKKKTPVARNIDRLMKPQAPKNSKSSESSRVTASSQDAAVAVPQKSNGPRQLDNFQAAMKLFHTRKLKEARDLFALASEGPERDVAQRARLHIAMCDRRLQQLAPNLTTAEDFYNYGVALINTRDVAGARAHLEKALEMSPDVDHIHYALALAQALGGDTSGAYLNLKRAIELEPRNRLIARQDADFAPLANQPPFDALVYPEKRGW
jgi:tetratricopeptide (TPR) repeat protein